MRIIVAALAATGAWASSAQADTDCAGAFEEIRAAVETDYVGYAVSIAAAPQRLARYRADAAAARAAAERSTQAACSVVLQRFVESIEDPHVFLLERPELSEAEAAASRARAERRRVSRRALNRAQAATAGLEGVWAAPKFDAAIIPERRGRYIAVVTQSRDEAWAAGDVAARFEREGEEWRATLYRDEDRAPLRVRAALQREGQMLHMAPLTWARRVAAANGFDPARPRAPSFAAISERAALLTIPSFAPEYGEALAALLATHDQAIRQRPTLIIDLRGNEGGSSGVAFQTLEPYYGALELEPFEGPRPHPGALSSPRMLRHYRGLFEHLPADSDARPIYENFLARMEASPGAVVPFFESPEIAAGIYARGAPQSVHEAPARVAILVDRYSVSAAEAFVLEARRSPRVTIYGEPTGGSIDYQNVAMFTVGEGPTRHFLGLPTMASSDQLPERGFNAAGVPVDVALPPGSDWVAAVASEP